jgi:site-specific DNA-methyltransferase (adenine-specific)
MENNKKIEKTIHQHTTDTEQTMSETNIIPKLIHGDCIEKLDAVEEKSIQTIIIDPPYNINKAEWDVIPDYIAWLTNIVEKLEGKLRDNGSLFIFHNDMEQIAELIISLKKNTKLVFRQMIVWNKRFDGSKKKGYLDGYVIKTEMHTWNKMAEYILFYTFDNSHKLLERRKELNISQLTISQEIKSKTGGITGWYSNLESGRNLPTRDTIKPIKKHLGLDYEDIVPKFHNLKTNHSVWNYDMAKRNNVHITPKPEDLLENLIRHTTDEGDILLDCFAGSGSLGKACMNTGRNCILIEKNADYFEYMQKTLLPKDDLPVESKDVS